MGRSIVGRDQWLAWVAEQAESGLSNISAFMGYEVRRRNVGIQQETRC